MNGTQIRAPMTLNVVWTNAALRASGGFPMAASCAVIDVPMLAPRMRAMASSSVIKPCAAREITIAVVAADDWTSAVNNAPRRIPTQTLEMEAIAFWNPG